MKNDNLILIIFTIVLGLLVATPVYADDDAGVKGEDTIMVLEEDDTPEVIDNIIILPDHVPDRAVTRSQHGRETAGEAREKGRVFGQERALEARERNMSDQAKEARERNMSDQATIARENARKIGDEKAQEARDRRMDEPARERVENENRDRKNEVKPERPNPAGK